MMLSLHNTGGWSKPKLLGWNTSYISSIPGILNILEMVMCILCIHLMNISCRPAYTLSVGGFVGSPQDVYFYIICNTSLMVTFTIFFCFIISQSSFMLAERTVMVVVFWLFSSFALLITSSSLLFMNVEVLYVDTQPEVSTKFASSVLGMINSLFYLSNGVLSYKACKNSWLQL